MLPTPSLPGMEYWSRLNSSAFRDSAEELLEKHNYVVLYFDNNADRLLAFPLFDIHTVRDS